MNKDEHIEYWIKSSDEDWETIFVLFNNQRFAHCLFFAHLSLEKLLKALWVKNNINNIPPKTHNLIKLVSDANLEISTEHKQFLFEFNAFQLEGRYPDYLFEIYKTCDTKFTTETLNKVKEIKTCLLKKLS